MPGKNLWNKAVTRVEHDARARETRLRLQRLERLLARCPAAARPVRLWGRILGLAISFAAPSHDESAGSSNDQFPDGMPVAVPTEMIFLRSGLTFPTASPR